MLLNSSLTSLDLVDDIHTSIPLGLFGKSELFSSLAILALMVFITILSVDLLLLMHLLTLSRFLFWVL